MREILGFRRALQERSSERVVPTAHGTAFLSPSIRHVYDHNYLSVDGVQAPAAVLATEADDAMADCFHRRVIAEHGAPGLATEFLALGFILSTHLVLAHRREPDRRVDASMVREVPLDELLPARTVATLREPWGDAEIADQLSDAKRHVAAAVPTRYFGAFADGELAGWCELRAAGGVAQIEDVEVLQEFRERGLGRALVQHALDEARGVAKVVFLEALADDWPRELYAKLGFVAVGTRDLYTKLPPPLARLRLRTPRLELRVATEAERRLLLRSAADEIQRPDVALVAFRNGEPIGTQVLSPDSEQAETGAWLVAECQGMDYEGEMRAAVLTYLRADAFSSPVPVEIVGAEFQ